MTSATNTSSITTDGQPLAPRLNDPQGRSGSLTCLAQSQNPGQSALSGNPGQSVVLVIAPSVPAGATPPGNRAAIPITRPAFPCDWSAYLSPGLLVLPCTVVIALDGLRGLCALSDGRARAAKFIRNSGAGTAGPECSRTAVAARSIRTLGLQRVPSSRKSLVTCSIAAMPLASAASSSRKAGEWLAGAVAGSMPSPVAPTRK